MKKDTCCNVAPKWPASGCYSSQPLGSVETRFLQQPPRISSSYLHMFTIHTRHSQKYLKTFYYNIIYVRHNCCDVFVTLSKCLLNIIVFVFCTILLLCTWSLISTLPFSQSKVKISSRWRCYTAKTLLITLSLTTLLNVFYIRQNKQLFISVFKRV